MESVNVHQSCVISGFHREVDENCVLLDRYTPSSTHSLLRNDPEGRSFHFHQSFIMELHTEEISGCTDHRR